MKKADKQKVIDTLNKQGLKHIIFKKDGSIRVMKGYFYRGQGGTIDDLKAKVLTAYPNASIVDSGDHFTTFKGGSPIHKQSHIYVIFKINLVESNK